MQTICFTITITKTIVFYDRAKKDMCRFFKNTFFSAETLTSDMVRLYNVEKVDVHASMVQTHFL